MTIEAERVDPITWVVFAIFCLIFLVLTTMILLYFGEAPVWLYHFRAKGIVCLSEPRSSEPIR